MGKYDDLLKTYKNQAEEESQLLSVAVQGMQEMLLDERRVVDLYTNADKTLLEIDEKFRNATNLDKTDMPFLMLATALQIGRWIVIAKMNSELSGKIKNSKVDHNEKSITDMEKGKRKEYQKKHEDNHVKGKHRDWTNIVFDGVPYDITKGSSSFKREMEGAYHRQHTLGHDPILGWIFGTMNILSDTITLEDFTTFNVCMDKGMKRWTGRTTCVKGFCEAVESIKEDQNRLPAAVFAQALHLKSDVFTKLGLPIPILETFAPGLANSIYKEGYDSLCLVKDVAVIGVQAVASIIINMLISCIHGLFYDPEKHKSRELYEVKTRKILSISNVIASTSNIIWVGVEKAWNDLDIGGILVTIYRLVTDVKFISEVEQEYLENEWYKQVVGKEYQFITEADIVGKKSIEKGIVIQAKADAAKDEKVVDGLMKHSAMLKNIESGQKTIHNTVETVLKDMKDTEARTLYGIEPDKTPLDLGDNEKKALCATLYSLLEENNQITENQRQFYLNFEQYLGMSQRITGFDYSKLQSIDSHSDRMIVVDVLCSFFFLNKQDFSFTTDADLEWLRSFAVVKDIDYVCNVISKEYSVVGVDGIISRFKKAEITKTEEELVDDVKIEAVTEVRATVTDENRFLALREKIKSYTSDEAAFGKCVNSSLHSALKEIQKAFPQIDNSTVITVSKVENGYMLFTTHALYLKPAASSKKEYMRIPYSGICVDELAMGLGKIKGSRKLRIPFIDDSGEKQIITIDDSKIEEEKLRDLIRDIRDSRCFVADSDSSLNMPELKKPFLELYFKALGNIMLRSKYGLAELYLTVKDYGLDDRWNDLAAEFSKNDELQNTIIKFFDEVPYPSGDKISQQAVILALQTICRANQYEGREASTLTDETERYVRLFNRQEMDQKTFNEALMVSANSKRTLDANVVFFLRERLDSSILYADSIKSGAESMDKEIAQIMKNRKNAFGDNIKDAAKFIPTAENIKDGANKVFKNIKNPFGDTLKGVVKFIPTADDIKDGANKAFKNIKKPSKNEELKIPADYHPLKQKLPEGVGIPKGAKGYSMRTGNTSVILINYPVSETQTMPFDDSQSVIDELHRNLGENEGIIEVSNGTTAGGRPYIYEIIKHGMKGANNIFLGVEYTLNINVQMDNSIQFFNGSFAEEGTTGMRESIGLELFKRANNIEDYSDMVGWLKDPYEPEYKKGLLMNASEKAELDEQFPWHALSEARNFVKYIIKNN